MSSTMQSRDKWIPRYFVLFFAFIALVNGVMVWLAVNTHTGLVTEHPYEKGLAYNQVVNAEQAQEALGWGGNIAFDKHMLTFTLLDRTGAAVAADRVTAHFMRPTQEGMDFDVTLSPVADGMWQAEVTPPHNGLWEVRVYAEQGSNRFQQAKRIVVP
ncbi:MAG: FixH family protein [Alphaproteobacteria bacterium]|nr:FixH family protein [Alphaproteobacteria bacterium]